MTAVLHAVSRTGWALAAVVVVVLAVAVAAGLARGPAGTTPAAPSAPGEPTPAPPTTTPARDVLLGAWVRPEEFTAEGRLAAVARFEQELGAPLDVAHVYHEWADPWPTVDDRQLARDHQRLLLSWGGTDTRQVASGQDDELIRQRARDLREWGVPVLLRWRWEMDRPNLEDEVHGPEAYIAAWHHIRTIFAAEGATNAEWVWCPLANGFDEGRSQPFYPGDDAVDWLCADVYPGPDVLSFEDAATPFLRWARQHPQPVIIGELGMDARHGQQRRRQWLADMVGFVREEEQIAALVYFDSTRPDGRPPLDMSLLGEPEAMQVLAHLARHPDEELTP